MKYISCSCLQPLVHANQLPPPLFSLPPTTRDSLGSQVSHMYSEQAGISGPYVTWLSFLFPDPSRPLPVKPLKNSFGAKVNGAQHHQLCPGQRHEFPWLPKPAVPVFQAFVYQVFTECPLFQTSCRHPPHPCALLGLLGP